VLWTIVVILMILWLLSMVSAYRLGGFVFPMLVVERVVLFIDLITGRKLHLEEHIFDDQRLH
jgi:Family of unknown function (DUF5670)